MYGDWIRNIAKNIQRKLDEIQAPYNFDLGDEFEVCICESLKQVLPARYGVCRGFVVSASGEKAGDDVIIYDAARFPILRCLGSDFSRKEQVPAEGVLAYIEAKHTLKIVNGSGQSLDKALVQVANIRSLKRISLEHRHMVPNLDLGAQVKPPIGYPGIKNPWYTSVWSRYVDGLENAKDIVLRKAGSVDVGLATDSLFTPCGYFVPMLRRSDEGRFVLRPFLCESTQHVWCDGGKENHLGLAVVHLLLALEWIQCSDIPWNQMMTDVCKSGEVTFIKKDSI